MYKIFFDKFPKDNKSCLTSNGAMYCTIKDAKTGFPFKVIKGTEDDYNALIIRESDNKVFYFKKVEVPQ